MCYELLLADEIFDKITLSCLVELCAMCYFVELCAMWWNCVLCGGTVCYLVELCAIWWNCVLCGGTVCYLVELCAMWGNCVLFGGTTILSCEGRRTFLLDFSCGGLHKTQLESALSLVAWNWILALKLEDGQNHVQT